MLKYAEALEHILKVARHRTLAPERIDVMDAIGRVCAEDLVSDVTVPPFDNSAMDGFAVNSRALRTASQEHPIRLKILGRLAAGDVPPTTPVDTPDLTRDNFNGAWEIMTGAPFPVGFDASVKIEDTLVIKDSSGQVIEVEINSPVADRQNRRGAGEDFKIGTPAIRCGERVTAEHVIAFATLGLSQISVRHKPRVALISTGRELAAMDQVLAPGQIRNSTAPYLVATLRQHGVDVSFLGIIADDPDEFQKVMSRVLRESYDIVLTTGAVSMGRFDFVTEGIERLGAKIYFHKVAIRPGKPLLFSEVKNGPAIFSMPGNPVSGVVALRFFVTPYMRELQRLPPERTLRARLTEKVMKPEGLRCFFKARLSFGEGEPRVQVLPGQMSFMVRPLLASTAWAILPEEGSELAKDTWVDVYPLHAERLDLRADAQDSVGTPAAGGCC